MYGMPVQIRKNLGSSFRYLDYLTSTRIVFHYISVGLSAMALPSFIFLPLFLFSGVAERLVLAKLSQRIWVRSRISAMHAQWLRSGRTFGLCSPIRLFVLLPFCVFAGRQG